MASKIISLTVKATGALLGLSANKIVRFTASGSNTLITYINRSGSTITKLVTESVSAINTAAARTQAITLVGGLVEYIHSDKIIYIDATTAGCNIIYYDETIGGTDILYCTTSASAVNSAAGNTFGVPIQKSGVTRYINNLYVDMITGEAVVTPATLAFTMKAKSGTGVVTAGGSLYTSATVTFTGGGPGAVVPTATATVGGGAVTAITLVTAGSNITQIPTLTITGDGTGATGTMKYMLDTLTIVDGGADYNTAPTLAFSAGTITATATATINAATQKVNSTSITNAGSYLTIPTLTLSGGDGCRINYDSKLPEFDILEVALSKSTITTTINALT